MGMLDNTLLVHEIAGYRPDNLPLPLLARKRDKRQSDSETIGAYITHLHTRHVLCAMRMPSNL